VEPPATNSNSACACSHFLARPTPWSWLQGSTWEHAVVGSAWWSVGGGFTVEEGKEGQEVSVLQQGLDTHAHAPSALFCTPILSLCNH
jgi:hypothetical protein